MEKMLTFLNSHKKLPNETPLKYGIRIHNLIEEKFSLEGVRRTPLRDVCRRIWRKLRW